MNIRWNEILSNKVFWSGYYAQSEDTLEYPLMWLQHLGLDQTSNVDQEELNVASLPVDIRLRVPFPSGFALEWSFFTHYSTSTETLYLVHPEQETPLKIGWFDCHWHNDSFRRTEKYLLTQYSQNQWEATFDQVYFPLLLEKYSPVTVTDDLALAQLLFLKEWEATGIFKENEIEQYSQILPLFSEELVWFEDTRYGWVNKGGYSLRNYQSGNPEVLKALQDFFRSF